MRPLSSMAAMRVRVLTPSAASVVQRRFLNLHECQSQKIFSDFGVGVPRNIPAFSVGEAADKAKELPGDEVLVKARVLAGGCGLGHFKENNFQGDVHTVPKDKVVETAEKMLGKTLVAKQTGEAGGPNSTLLLAEKVSIATEKYFAILMDRGSGGPLMIGSKTGGTSIEDIAAKDPSARIKVPVDIMDDGIAEEEALSMATEMGFDGPQAKAAGTLIANLCKVFVECDCTMLEINPLAELKDGRVLVCEAKVSFDNAAFGQKAIHSQRDISQENAQEVEAKRDDLNYIKLDGSVSCMVNGAGLAMATMDLLSILGGRPAISSTSVALPQWRPCLLPSTVCPERSLSL